MPYSVTVQLNPVRTELRRLGYAVGRDGWNMRPAAMAAVYDERAGVYASRIVPTEDPPTVWREPETGAILPRPSGLSATLFSDPAQASRWVALNQLQTPSGLLEETVHPPGGARMMYAKLPSDGSPPGSLTPPAWLSGFLPSGFVWAAQTVQPLAADESFALLVQPYGVAADRPEWLAAVAFGGRHVLAFASNGQGRYYGYAEGSLRPLTDFAYGAGMDLAQPFLAAVVPFGPRYLAVAASGQTPPAKDTGLRERASGGALIDLFELGVPIDEIAGAMVKIPAAPVLVAIPAAACGFGIHRCRFAETQLAFAPEQLDGPRSVGSSPVRAIGYNWWGSGATTAHTNDSGSAWNASTDDRLVPWITLTPSSDGVHAPELWGYEVEIAPETFAPTHQPTDASAMWTSIHIRLSAHPAEDECRIRLERSADFPRLLKHDCGVRVSQDGTVVFDGCVVRHTRVPYGFTADGYRAGLEDEIVAEDMWRRLAQTPARWTLPLSRRSVGAAVRHLLSAAGFQPSQMQIDSRLDSMQVGDWDGGNVWLAAASDSTVADVLRALIDGFGIQYGGDLRVRWDGSKWVCGWRAGTAPTAAFVLDSSLIPSLVSGWDGADASRWAAKVLKIFTQPEFHVAPMPFNALAVEAPYAGDREARAWRAQISPRPAALDDPADAMYDGRLVPAFEPVGRTQFAGGYWASAAAARRRWDAEFRASRTVSFSGEFRAAAVGPDDMVWIAARSPVAVPSLSIAAGDPVSLGAWVVEEIQAEIEGDDDGSGGVARRAFHEGNYTLSWWGPYSRTGFPMFTEVLPIP